MDKDMKLAREKWYLINKNALDNKIRYILGNKSQYISKCWDEAPSFQCQGSYGSQNYYTPQFSTNY
jgi:hypothetical protein